MRSDQITERDDRDDRDEIDERECIPSIFGW